MGRKYSIAVQTVSDDASEASSPRISAVVQVDEDGPQVVELTVGAVDGGPIPSMVARDIDFAQLTDALNGVVSAISHRTGPSRNGVRPAAERKAAEPAHDGRKTPAETTEVEGRPYRKMPDAKDVTAVIERTQSVGKLAEHFGVPRYTAQAWVNRLRRSGQLGELDRHQAKA